MSYHFQNVVCLFCAFNIARDIKNFVQNSTIFLYISGNIESTGLGSNYVIIVSRIIHVKVDRRLNVTNKFKYQRRLLSRLAIVMFRGTPCMWSPRSSSFDFTKKCFSGNIYNLFTYQKLQPFFVLTKLLLSKRKLWLETCKI